MPLTGIWRLRKGEKKEAVLEWGLVVAAVGLVVEGGFEGAERLVGRGVGVSAIAFEDFPSMKIHVMAAFVLRATDVEVNVDFVAFGQIVE